MKKLLVVLFMALSLTGFCQSRIGTRIDKVKAEYSNPQYGLKIMKADTSTYLTLQDKFAFIIHRFGRDSVCNKTYVTLTDTTIANQMASTYDAIYEPVSPIEWIVRLPHDILDVELVMNTNEDKNKKLTFQWTRANR